MAAALDDFLRVISNAVNVDISILNFQCFYQVYFILEANFPTCFHRFTAGSFAGASKAAAGNRYQQLRVLLVTAVGRRGGANKFINCTLI